MSMEDDALAEAYARGLAAERGGDASAAVAAFREALALDPADHGGVALRLAALGAAPAPEKAPPAYVATLFDQHAEVFDGMLVDQLGYHAPMRIRERFQALGLGPFGRLLDLGCGTGLVGESLEDMAAHRTGVDLAEGMLEIADEKEVYDALFVGDAEGFLAAAEDEVWDLITAADVLPYLGETDALFAAVARRLAPGGLFVFSTETAPDSAFDGRSWLVLPQRRYAHAFTAVEGGLAAAGLAVLEAEPIVVRYEEGRPSPGHLVIARKG